MKLILRFFPGLLALFLFAVTGAKGELVNREWTVDGVKRQALLHLPAVVTGQAVPVLFAFHGHGGSMRQAAESYRFEQVWPEAIVVYMDGLPTPGVLTDAAGQRQGWQKGPGAQGNRDVKFFDAVLQSLRSDYKVDDKRIYATGHSNGGSFTYLLWAMRAEVFAAFGPSAAVVGRDFGPLRPKPVIHVAGEKDPLVKFGWQEHMIENLRRINQCGEGRPSANGCTLYDSKIGAPVMTYIHGGTHKYPPEASGLIVDFFKNHPKA